MFVVFQVLIDYLKFDVEHAEWKAIPNMVKTGALRNVKQIGFEVHRPRGQTTEVFHLIELLTKQGFRKWNYHFNPACTYTTNSSHIKTSQCIELYYLNMNVSENKLV